MLSDMKERIKATKDSQDGELKKLIKGLNETKIATDRLYEAVERDPCRWMLHYRNDPTNCRRENRNC